MPAATRMETHPPADGVLYRGTHRLIRAKSGAAHGGRGRDRDIKAGRHLSSPFFRSPPRRGAVDSLGLDGAGIDQLTAGCVEGFQAASVMRSAGRS